MTAGVTAMDTWHKTESKYPTAKLSLCLISHYAAKVDGAVKAYVYTFFVLDLDKPRLLASLPSCVIFRTFCAEEWMDIQSQFEGDYSGSRLRKQKDNFCMLNVKEKPAPQFFHIIQL